MPRIKEVLNEIDVPNDQVLIESRIVEVSRRSGLRLGFNYGFKGGGTDVAFNTFNLPAAQAGGGGGDAPIKPCY